MKTNSTPRVSIGLPVYNGENFLVEAIKSLLAQTFTDFELIISDNASTDATSNICRDIAAKDPRIQYHRSTYNRGAAWNYNHTFQLSQGEYFKWAAHDDMQQPKFLEKCVNFLDHNKNVVLCFTKIMFIDEDSNELKQYEHPIDVSQASRRQLFCHFVGASHIDTEIFGLIRSEVLRKTRLIDGFVGSDFVLLGELALYGSFCQIPECLFLHREHSGRSTAATKGPEDYTQWFDSSKSVCFAMPYWRRLYESTISVMRQPLKISEKMGCLIEICRAAKWSKRALVAEILRVSKQDIKKK